MDDSDIKQLMQEIEFVLKRNQNEKYYELYLPVPSSWKN